MAVGTVAPLLKPEKPAFVMPTVDIGDPVIWLSSPEDTRGQIVLVTKVNQNSINVVVLPTLRPLTAIRHRADPFLEGNPDILRETGGCWEESSKMQRMREIEKTIASLAEEVGVLRGMVKSGRKTDGG